MLRPLSGLGGKLSVAKNGYENVVLAGCLNGVPNGGNNLWSD